MKPLIMKQKHDHLQCQDKGLKNKLNLSVEVLTSKVERELSDLWIIPCLTRDSCFSQIQSYFCGIKTKDGVFQLFKGMLLSILHFSNRINILGINMIACVIFVFVTVSSDLNTVSLHRRCSTLNYSMGSFCVELSERYL